MEIQEILSNIVQFFSAIELPSLDKSFWAVLGFVGAIIFFLFKHYLKARFIDGKPCPQVRLLCNDKSTKSLTLNLKENVDIDTEIHKRVNHAVADLRSRYQTYDLDVYNNPALAIPGRFDAARMYNGDVSSYVESMESYYFHTIRDEIYSEYIVPVNFSVKAKGKKVCTDLKVYLKIEGNLSHLFDAHSCQQRIGRHEVEPKLPSYDVDPFVACLIPNDTCEYQYNEWNLTKQSSTLQGSIAKLVPGDSNTDSLPNIFVDTRYPQTVTINYTIYGSDIGEKGKTGKVTIKVK